MMRRYSIAIWAILAISIAAPAQSWPEQGDAADLPPGQTTSGFGPLNQIGGALSDGEDVDLYVVNITNPGAFNASTTGTGFDTQLFLFAPDGNGVAFSDNIPVGNPASQITGALVPGPGLYVIGISGFDRDPLNPGSQPIWNDNPRDGQRPPDGPGAPGPVTNWNSTATTVGPYTINLSGAQYAIQPTNDTCANATSVPDGSHFFSTLGANTDGPPDCGTVSRDVWFRYDANECAAVTVSTCGQANYNTIIVVYEGLGCAPAGPITCNDDACGAQSSVTFNATAGGQYLLRIGGFGGAAGTGTVTINSTPLSAPSIVSHPAWQPVEVGGNATFSVTASGSGPLTYSWYHAGDPVGGNSDTLTITNATQDDHGPYYVVVGNSCGDTRSHSADLTVHNACEPPIAVPGSCYVPEVWRIDPVPWNRDVSPQNKIDDLIDADSGVRHDIVVDFRECVTQGQIDFLEDVGGLSDVQLPFLTIASVAMTNVSFAEMQTIAGSGAVAIIEKQVTVETDTADPSLETIRVIGPYYSPTTVEDAYGLHGNGFNIAILDTGVDDTLHDTFTSDPPFVGGYNALTDVEGNPDDDNMHGTHVASIALGRGGFAVPRGVAPAAGLIDVKVLGASGSGSVLGVMKGLEKVIVKQRDWNVHIINMSLGGPNATNGVESFSQMTDRAVEQGMIVIAAAGNSYPGVVSSIPARASRAISVAASRDHLTPDRSDDDIAPFSQAGPAVDNLNLDGYDELKPEVTAPGWNIFGALYNTPMAGIELSGTSMASPHVAGIAALCLQAKPDLDPEGFRALIINTAEAFGAASPAGIGFDPPGWNDRFGWGLVDAYAAVTQLLTLPTEVTFGTEAVNAPWDNRNIGPEDFPPQCGVPNRFFAIIRNTGANAAANVRVEFGVYNFSGSAPPFIYVGTAVIPVLLSGATETVFVDWLPNCTTLSAHQCLRVEIGCDNDTDTLNNRAQRNLDVTASPVYFQAQNFVHAAPVTIDFIATFENPGAGWGVQITPASVTLGPTDIPPTIEALPLPPPGANDGDMETIHIESRASDGTCLGGITILATVKDCNGNHIDDWFDIRDATSADCNANGLPDECEAVPGCDTNCDGSVNPFDIQSFVELLGSTPPAACSPCAGDANADGTVNPFDINAFLVCIGG